MMRGGLWAALILCGTAPIATAGDAKKPPRPEEFAFGAEVQADGQGPVLKAALTEEIYRGLRRPDLGDLRVFNAQGEILSHEFRHVTSQPYENRMAEKLPLFPIEGAVSDGAASRAIEIREDRGGNVLNVRVTGNAPAKKFSAVTAYLADLRKFDRGVETLNFDWDAPPKGILAVDIEGSDDLKHWIPLVHRAPLARLSFGGQSLQQRTVDLGGRRNRYLRVRSSDGQTLVLHSVTAIFVSAKSVEVQRTWTAVIGTPNPENHAEYFFDAGGVIPTDQLKVELPETNTLAHVALSSRNSESATWTPRREEHVYRVTSDGHELVSPPIAMPPVSDRFWRLAILGTDAALGTGIPKLVFGWVPHDLIFLARGPGPFRVAYGSAVISRADVPLALVLEGIRRTEGEKALVPQSARILPGRSLGGEARLQPPAPPVPWKKWALWVALGLAVASLAWMARGLYRDLGVKKA